MCNWSAQSLDNLCQGTGGPGGLAGNSMLPKFSEMAWNLMPF